MKIAHKQKIIVILGQTSTGKSDFAVQIAKKVNGEIISADSRQIYKGMDLGTGKITKKEMRSVPHHMLDVASPKKMFTVSHYKKLADKKIKEIIHRGHVPIVCGGTGFYIDVVVNGIILPEVPPNNELRLKLAEKSTEQLHMILKRLDSARAENIDQNNKVRLIRAIEIAKALGKVPSLNSTSQDLVEFQTLKIGLILPDEILKNKIHTRILTRIKKGMLKEIALLHTQGLSWKRMEELGLEYRYGAQHLKGEIAKKEMLEKIITETWHYAKRQMTWFKRDKEILWINPTNKHEVASILKEIKNFLV